MPTPRKYDIDPVDSDPNGIAEDQQPDNGTPVVLDGAQSDLGTALQWDIGDAYSSGIAGIQISFESAGNWSGVTFTITGKDEFGNSQTEAFTGPNATTATTTTYWSQITSITCDDTVATDIEIGPADVFVSTSVALNKYNDVGTVVAIGGLSGTCQFDIEVTYDNVMADGFTPSTVWIVNTSNASADNAGITLPVGVTGVRLKMDSYTNGAELQFYVMDYPSGSR